MADSKKAIHGQKMIEVKVRLWTNGLADAPNNIRPKHARTSGVVRLKRNDLHGIKDVKPIPFHSIFDLTSVIEKILLREGITLHPSRKMRKLMGIENAKKTDRMSRSLLTPRSLP